MSDAAMEVPTRRVDMWYAGPAPQRRLTVAFRIILAVPQFIVLWFLSVALFVVVVIGWFAALVTGRLPQWAHEFIGGVVRWYTRVGAYLLLLTDRYPPFSLGDEEYPARPILPGRGRLNRWAVLFRIILAVPAAVFYEIVEYGLTLPLLFAMWVVVLITGGMPRPLYDAYSALLRYAVRFHAWFTMLTSEYAWGMLGDPVTRSSAASGATPAYGTPPWAPPPDATPAPPPATTGVPGDRSAYPPPPAPFSYPPAPAGADQTTPSEPVPEAGPASDEPAPAPAPAPGWPPPIPAPAPPAPPGVGAMPPPSPWERTAAPLPPGPPLPPWGTLVLQGAARGWMIFAIVWGSILFVTQDITQNVIIGHGQSDVQQFSTVQADTNRADSAIQTAGAKAGSCQTVACLRPAHLAAAASLTQLADDLRGMRLPSNARGEAQNVESDASQLASVLTKLANSSDGTTYRATAQSSDLSSLLSAYSNDTTNLLRTLDADL